MTHVGASVRAALHSELVAPVSHFFTLAGNDFGRLTSASNRRRPEQLFTLCQMSWFGAAKPTRGETISRCPTGALEKSRWRDRIHFELEKIEKRSKQLASAMAKKL